MAFIARNLTQLSKVTARLEQAFMAPPSGVQLVVPRLELLPALRAPSVVASSSSSSSSSSPSSSTLAPLAFDLRATRTLIVRDASLTAQRWRELLTRSANLVELQVDSGSFCLSVLVPLPRLRVLRLGPFVRHTVSTAKWYVAAARTEQIDQRIELFRGCCANLLACRESIWSNVPALNELHVGLREQPQRLPSSLRVLSG